MATTARFMSISRSLMSSTSSRTSSLRSLPRLHSPPFSSSRPRRFSFAPSRNFAELGCTQSLLPFNGAATIPRLTAHLSADVRAFSELFNGTFCRTCQDR